MLLHLLVVGLVPLADATLEAAAAAESRQVHVEAEGNGVCPPGHDHLVCQLCRVVGREVLVEAGGSVAVFTRTHAYSPAPAAARIASTLVVSSPLGARAPPRA